MRNAIFRSVSGLFGLWFLWCYLDPGFKAARGNDWIALTVAIYFMLHSLLGEDFILYRLLGFSAPDAEKHSPGKTGPDDGGHSK